MLAMTVESTVMHYAISTLHDCKQLIALSYSLCFGVIFENRGLKPRIATI